MQHQAGHTDVIMRIFESKNIARLTILFFGVAFCFFLLDAIYDIKDHIAKDRSYQFPELMHLILELISALSLGLGIVFIIRYIKLLDAKHEETKSSLSALRTDFERFVSAKFRCWDLSKAETDVGFLLLKGISLADISDFRNTSIGTIKAQSHSIFKKSNVSSRVEFMALFMDEFIDIGMEQESDSASLRPKSYPTHQ